MEKTVDDKTKEAALWDSAPKAEIKTKAEEKPKN